MFKNHKKKSKQSNEIDDVDVDEPSNECMFKKSKQSNEIDDVDVDEDVDEDVVDFIEIGNNVFLNKKNDQVYEIADDDDLNEDLF